LALVIGNSNYAANLALENPINDAVAIGRALEALRYAVTLKLNLTYFELNAAIDRFIEDLQSSPVKVGLFYFSGHGIQVNEQHYIVHLDYNDAGVPGLVQLVRLQAVIDRISDNSRRGRGS
jgi:uncharacterized caspase-like protein